MMSRIYEAPFIVEVGAEFHHVVKIDCIANFTCDWNEGMPCDFEVRRFWVKLPGMERAGRVSTDDFLHDMLLEAFVMDEDWLADIVRDAEDR